MVAAPRTVSEMFALRLEHDPDREFLIVPDGRAWTFRDIDALADDLTECLRSDGVGRGSVVGLLLWNDPASFVSVLAVWRLGAIAALCGAVSPTGEARRRFELVGATAVISGDARKLDGRWPVIEVDVAGRAIEGRSTRGGVASAPALVLAPDDPACIYFTSGTTGDAKALVKSHGHIARSPGAHLQSPEFLVTMADPHKPPLLSFNPFGQSASFARLMFSLYVGRPLVLVRKFDIETVARLTTRYRPKTLQLTPAMIHMLAWAESEIDLSSLRYVNSGTAPLSPATQQTFEARYGVPILQAYGATEGGVTAHERYEDVLAGLRGPGAVGRITPGCAWRIVDADGRDVAPGDEGELLGRPDERTVLTAEGESTLPVDDGGWYHSGDVGRVDEQGILYITGRLKEMLIVGGFNVFPTEVENILRGSPMVRDAVVVPAPDDRLGEVPVAGVVWDEPRTPDLDQIERFRRLEASAREQLAAYKIPRRWFSLPAVPLTPNGKTDRPEATQLAKGAAQSVSDLESAALAPDRSPE
jgi:acyl-CoA synthetase (AMP-forming)/AMP-acid ligase II